MKIYALTITLLIVTTLVSVAYGQQHCMDQFLGSKTLYSPGQVDYTSAPEGYTPVFINYAGRHGARHLTKEVDSSLAYQLLAEADNAKALTVGGLKLKKMLQALQKIEKDNINSITLIGKQEQHDIATRMLKNYPTVFANHPPCVEIAVTKKLRTQQSAEAFLSGLQYSPAGPCNSTQNIRDEYLRFFDLAPAYLDYEKNGTWKKQILFFRKMNHLDIMSLPFIKKFFVPGFISHLKPKEEEQFMENIAGFAEILNSVKDERTSLGFSASDVDLFSWFTCAEWQALESAGSAEDFLLKGPGNDSMGIQVKIAAPLLVDFIQTTDSYITTKKTPANLRFSHAEMIAPFAALLGLEGASDATADIQNFHNFWKPETIIKLSANIQWILYKNNTNENWLIKCLLNEKEVRINGLSTTTYPYYKWMDVRKLYLKKLQTMDVHLKDDMNMFLLHVK